MNLKFTMVYHNFQMSERRRIIYITCAVILCLSMTYFFLMRSLTSISLPGKETVSTKPSNDSRILILYVWADIDVQAFGNLEFFIRHAVNGLQPADYYFILQILKNKSIDIVRLPKLPPNAHYVMHENECYDIGTHGWFLRKKSIDISLYKYFILMNSSVRGPFLTATVIISGVWWYTNFIRLLSDTVKLSGSTISCQVKPHVQSYILVTDRIGMDIWLYGNNSVFRCHQGYSEAVIHGEIEASQTLLRANYKISSLQMIYKDIDFRKKENLNCNSRMNPIYYDRAVDGLSHDPYELIFVKFKGNPPFDTDLERRAAIYQKWLETAKSKR